MAAPTPTARTTPTTNTAIKDGHKSTITFATAPTIVFREKTVTPPGFDGGEAVPIADMFSVTWRGKIPRHLKEMTNATIKVSYDPAGFAAIMALVNLHTTITVTLPSTATWAFYGYMKSFKPEVLEEGKQPEATIEIVPTNIDPSDFSEASPVYTAAA